MNECPATGAWQQQDLNAGNTTIACEQICDTINNLRPSCSVYWKPRDKTVNSYEVPCTFMGTICTILVD